MDFDAYRKFGGSPESLLKAKQQAEEKLVNAGYALPTFTSTYILDRYSQISDEEEYAAYKKAKKLKPAVTNRIEILKESAQVNLYNLVFDRFNNGEKTIELAFYKGMPDESTKYLLSNIDPAGGLLKHAREGSTCLPEMYHSQDSCIFTITPDGDSVMVDGKPFGQIDPVIEGVNNMISNTQSLPQEQ